MPIDTFKLRTLFITLAAACPILSYAGGGSDGGGQISEASFKVHAEQVRLALNSRSALADKVIGVPNIVARYTQAMATPATCAADPKIIKLLKDNKKMAWFVSGDNPHIYLDCDSTYEAFETAKSQSTDVLVFHEHCRAMGLQDDNYNISVRLVDFNQEVSPSTVQSSEVKNLIESMKLFGGDGSIRFTSSWLKNDGQNAVDKQIAEAKGLVSQYIHSPHEKVISSQTKIEEATVCEKWGVWTKELESSSSESHFDLRQSAFQATLTTAAAARATGLAMASGAALDSQNFALSKSETFVVSSDHHETDKVNYYYVRNGLKCESRAKYLRVVITLTKDILTLTPQDSAALIYGNFKKVIGKLNQKLTKIGEVTNLVVENPIFSAQTFYMAFKDFDSVKVYPSSVANFQMALKSVASEYKNDLREVHNEISNLSKNTFLLDTFGHEIEELNRSYSQLSSILTSLEGQKLSIRLNAPVPGSFGVSEEQDQLLIGQNEIVQLNGTPLQGEIKNQSILLPSLNEFLSTIAAYINYDSRSESNGVIHGENSAGNIGRMLRTYGFAVFPSPKVGPTDGCIVSDNYSTYCATSDENLKIMKTFYQKIRAGQKRGFFSWW